MTPTTAAEPAFNRTQLAAQLHALAAQALAGRDYQLCGFYCRLLDELEFTDAVARRTRSPAGITGSGRPHRGRKP